MVNELLTFAFMKKSAYLSILLIFSLQLISGQNLESPFSTVYTHLHNLQQEKYSPEISAKTIPLNIQNEEQRMEYAIHLKQILDGKGLFIQENDVPREENYTDSTTLESTYTLSPLEPRIYLEKIDGKWYYSKETIRNIDEMFNEVYPLGTKFFSRLLPAKIRNKNVLGLHAWQWLGIFSLLIGGFLAFFLLHKVIQKILHYLIYKKSIVSNEREESLKKIAKSLSLLAIFYLVYKLVPSLRFEAQTLQYLVKTITILLVFLVAILASRIFSHFVEYFREHVEKTASKLDDQLLPIIKKLFNIFIIIVACSVALKQLNVNLTAILAGLSIGGLALALASQDTVKNFIGSVTIFVDHPFEIGDYIILQGTEGTVEEVGMRATRLRTPNQSISYIPNGELSNMIIDNYGLRIYRRWKWFIGVEYDTSPSKIEEFCIRAKEVINDYEATANEHTLVRLNELGSSSINIMVNIFLDVPGYYGELACKHDLLIRLMLLTEELGVSFAFPTQTLHIKKEK